MAGEQRLPQLVLELADLHRQRRLGNEQLFGRAAQAARFGHRDEVAKVPQLHSVLSICSAYGSYTRSVFEIWLGVDKNRVSSIGHPS
jgi:hypothetical protein